MDADDYRQHDATGLAALVRQGEVSAEELRRAATARHHETHALINAVVEWYDDPTPATNLDGPLAGVPFLRKDAGATEAGRLVEMGSRLMEGYRAPETSPYFRSMAGAGVQVLGRSAVPELAQHGTTESEAFGPTRNPLDPTTSSGGSSGGAAAAVRAGVVPIAHATDAAGSIRIPAAVTGLLGLKPTRGLVPPSADRWNDLVCEFVLARSIRDIECCLDVLATAPLPAGPSGPRPELRVAVSRPHWAGLSTEPVVAAALDATVDLLEDRGHRVSDIGIPFSYEQLTSTWFPLFSGGVVAAIEQGAAATGRSLTADHLEPHTLEVVARVRALDPVSIEAAQAAARQVTTALTANLAPFDVLVTPTLSRAVIPLDRMAGDCPLEPYLVDTDAWFDRLYLANVTGWPAISVPAPVEGSIPIGIQLMAGPWQEATLLALARDLIGDQIVPPKIRDGWDRGSCR
jgi:amidase